MPANQSTPEVTRADREAIDRLKRFADSPDATVSEHADIVTVLSLIDRLSATPARGGDELLIDLKGALEYSAGCDEGVDQDTASSEIMGWAGAWLSLAYDKICARIASTDMAGAGEIDRPALTAAARLWWSQRMPNSTCVNVNIKGDGRVDVHWRDADEIGSYTLPVDFAAAPPVEGLTSGEGVGARSASFIAAREWLRKRWHQEWPNEAHCQQLADYADFLAASPKATATASVREGEVMRNAIIAGIASDRRRFNEHSPTWNAYGFCIDIAEHATLTDSGTAATIGGERA